MWPYPQFSEKSLMENFIFCAVIINNKLFFSKCASSKENNLLVAKNWLWNHILILLKMYWKRPVHSVSMYSLILQFELHTFYKNNLCKNRQGQ